MAKKTCAVCGKDLGLLAQKTALSDGVVCQACMKEAGIVSLWQPANYTSAAIKNLADARKPLVAAFAPTENVGAYLQADDKTRTFKVGNDLFYYDNLLSFELLEDGETTVKGGLGRAAVGGVLFGGVGAVVGGVTGGKKTKSTCTSMKIRLSLKNAHTTTAYIPLISAETKKDGMMYKASQDLAQKCLSLLQIIADQNQTEAAQAAAAPAAQAPSAADELMKFKQLLDAGVITQEEFDAKKKQLLGL